MKLITFTTFQFLGVRVHCFGLNPKNMRNQAFDILNFNENF